MVVYTVMHLIPWKQSHGSETERFLKLHCTYYSLFNLLPVFLLGAKFPGFA
jgi:hypothetical protein